MGAALPNVFSIRFFKDSSLWGIVLFIGFFSVMPLISLTFDISRWSKLTWKVPDNTELMHVSGALLPTYRVADGRFTDIWGRLRLPDGSTFPFTCDPNIDEAGCVYRVHYDLDQNIGKSIDLGFFDVSDKHYPEHIAMTARVSDSNERLEILSYKDSISRLKKYKNKSRFPSLKTFIMLLPLIVSAPGIVYRLATGRDPAPRKTPS